MTSSFWAGVLGGTLSGFVAGFASNYLSNVAAHSYKRTPHAWRSWFFATYIMIFGLVIIGLGLISVVIMSDFLRTPEAISPTSSPRGFTKSEVIVCVIFLTGGSVVALLGRLGVGQAWSRIAKAADKEKEAKESADG